MTTESISSFCCLKQTKKMNYLAQRVRIFRSLKDEYNYNESIAVLKYSIAKDEICSCLKSVYCATDSLVKKHGSPTKNRL